MVSVQLEKENVYFERLSHAHLSILQLFKCTEKELEKFLVEDAWLNQKQGISVTYLWFLKSNSKLIGYITLLTDSINLNADLKSFFREKSIYYKSLPALKIGRMAVSKETMRSGLGTMMVGFAISIVYKIYKETSGCRFLVLDAKQNSDTTEQPLHFYKKLNFQVLIPREKGTIPMYLDVWIQDIGENI